MERKGRGVSIPRGAATLPRDIRDVALAAELARTILPGRLATRGGFQSGKFPNAITSPPCVCLDKSIMRFYASYACFADLQRCLCTQWQHTSRLRPFHLTLSLSLALSLSLLRETVSSSCRSPRLLLFSYAMQFLHLLPFCIKPGNAAFISYRDRAAQSMASRGESSELHEASRKTHS